MNHNLPDIKSEVEINVKDFFTNSSLPSLSSFSSGFTFDEGVDVFFKTLVHKTGHTALDGLTKTVIPCLHEALISKKGELVPLKILASELEAYLKKIAYMTSNGVDDFTADKSKTLIVLVNHLRLHPTKTFTAADFTPALLPTYKNSDHFQEFICRAYLTRNAAHSSPNWKFSEVAVNLESIIVSYLYATFKFFNALKPIVSSINLPEKVKEESAQPIDSNRQALYDFISYNNGTSQIRNQIVTSFVLHTLSNHTSSISIKSLQEICNKHFNTEADLSFYKSLLKELTKPEVAKVTITGLFDNEVSLSPKEQARIKKVKEDFSYEQQFFALEVSEVLKQFGIEHHTIDVINKLTALLQANYNIDFKEIINDIAETNDISQNVKDFVTYLKTLLPKDSPLLGTLVKGLLQVCNNNDFLNKLTAGQVFAKLSNLPAFDSYIFEKERVIYLDTNVLLYVLCYFYEDDPTYENLYYQTVRDLFNFCRSHKLITLKTTGVYVQEVAFQMKEALLLVPFEGMGLFRVMGGSKNVFYQFYVHLRNNHNLDDNVKNFGDFMGGFDLYEEDTDSSDFFRTANSLIVEFLDELLITVVDLPYYNKDEVVDLMKLSLSMAGKTKDEIPMANDAAMICHLGDKSYHQGDPIFVPWDHAFYDIRKRYVQKFRRANFWHLFTPSKLLNHFQLLEFRIDSTNVSNDFLTIIDGMNLHEKTKNILDLVGQLLDIEMEERRKFLIKFKEFSAKYVFNVEDLGVQDVDELKLDLQPVEKVIGELFKFYFEKKSNYRFSDLKELFSKKEVFDDLVRLFQDALEHYMKERNVSLDTLRAFDHLIAQNKIRKS